MEEALQGSQGDVRNAPKQASQILVKINDGVFPKSTKPSCMML